MPDLRLENVTAKGEPPARPALEGKDEPQFVVVRCPNQKCRRVIVTVAAEGTIRIHCRDCKTKATFRIGKDGILGYDIENDEDLA